MSSSRRRLTLIDLYVVLLLLLVPAGAFVAALLSKARPAAGRIGCASNLRQIGQAIQIYASDNGRQFPRTRYDGQGVSLTEYSNRHSRDPFASDGPGPNDLTAPLFLLVRTTDIGTQPFVCPLVKEARAADLAGGTGDKMSNFSGRRELQYSYVNPYPTPSVAAAGFKLDLSLPPDFPIAADMNPGGSAVVEVTPSSPRQKMKDANTRNHNGDGQNVLYADGHVEYQNTPFCGMLRTPAAGRAAGAFRDNIYTFGGSRDHGGGVRGSPVDAVDAVLLPTAQDGPESADTTFPTSKGVALAAATGVLAVLLLMLRRRRNRSRAAATSGPTTCGRRRIDIGLGERE